MVEKRILLFTILFLLVMGALLGAWVFLAPPGMGTQLGSGTLPKENRIVAKHAFQDGIHRYTGTIRLPNSCYSVDAIGFVQNRQNVINFRVVDRRGEKVSCVKVATRYPFSITMESNEDAETVFSINDDSALFVLREVSWKETISLLAPQSLDTP